MADEDWRSAVRRVAPKSLLGLHEVASMRRSDRSLTERLQDAEERGADLSRQVDRLRARVDELEALAEEHRAEVDELRADSRRIAELYDLVMERLGR